MHISHTPPPQPWFTVLFLHYKSAGNQCRDLIVADAGSICHVWRSMALPRAQTQLQEHVGVMVMLHTPLTPCEEVCSWISCAMPSISASCGVWLLSSSLFPCHLFNFLAFIRAMFAGSSNIWAYSFLRAVCTGLWVDKYAFFHWELRALNDHPVFVESLIKSRIICKVLPWTQASQWFLRVIAPTLCCVSALWFVVGKDSLLKTLRCEEQQIN